MQCYIYDSCSVFVYTLSTLLQIPTHAHLHPPTHSLTPPHTDTIYYSCTHARTLTPPSPHITQIRYYDSKQETRSNGVISLTDILSVNEAEPQVVPALKPGEAGFFFNVSAQCIQGFSWLPWFSVIAGGHSQTDLPFDGIERL